MATAKKRVHPDALGRLIRAMDKHSLEVIEELYKCCTQNDDLSIKHKASKDYLGTLKDLKQQADDRDLKKLLAQAKLLGGKLGTEDDESSVPLVNFDVVQEV